MKFSNTLRSHLLLQCKFCVLPILQFVLMKLRQEGRLASFYTTF